MKNTDYLSFGELYEERLMAQSIEKYTENGTFSMILKTTGLSQCQISDVMVPSNAIENIVDAKLGNIPSYILGQINDYLI